MAVTPRISEAEWRVMRVLWEESPLSANEVVERIGPSASWKPKTVKTLLNRLAKKKAIDFTKDGRAYMYFPLVREADCAMAESRSLLEKVFDGALAPMLAQFVDNDSLSDKEIEELKRVLERRGE